MRHFAEVMVGARVGRALTYEISLLKIRGKLKSAARGLDSVDANTTVHRKRETIFTRLDDELLAIDADAGKYFSLSGSGCRIWELIESPMSIGSICDQLTAELDVDRQRCAADVMSFVTDLSKHGLIDVDVAGVAPASLP